jgi:hypothetical protein
VGDVRTIFDPEVSVIIETDGRLQLANVGRFLQRLDTAARRTSPRALSQSRAEIVELTTGSLKIRLAVVGAGAAVASAAFGGGSFAVSLAQYLRDDPAASRSCRALIENDNGTVIVVKGYGQSIPITLNDLSVPEHFAVAASDEPQRVRAPAPQVIRGPREGFVRHYEGQDWVELDDRPGLRIQIRDERPDRTKALQPNLRYVLDGDAHFGGLRQPSFFVLREATLLE